MPTHTTLKGVSHIADSLVSDQLEANLINFFQWGFLGVGGFFTIRKDSLAHVNGSHDQSRLRPVTDPSYTDGQVWEGFRKDWVWESGVEYAAQPIRVSGVWINNVLRTLDSGVVVDYPNGRVVLTSPVAQSSTVQCEYSYRLFQVYTADHPAWQQIQTDSFRVDDPHFLQAGSGAWDVLAQNRVQLPAVFVEAVPNASRHGTMIGGGVTIKQSVLFHILAEDRWHYKWLHDAISNQWEKKIYGFDKNLLLTNDFFPLNESGSPRTGAIMYPDLVKPTGEGGYYWDDIIFADMKSVDQPRFGGLWRCTVRGTMEVNRPE